MSTTTIIIAAIVLAVFIFAMYSEAYYDIEVLQRKLHYLEVHKETLGLARRAGNVEAKNR